MFYEIFTFEIRSRLKKPSTYIYFGIFAFFAFMIMCSMGGAFKTFDASVNDGGRGNVFANAPYILHDLINVMSYFGLLITAGLMGNAAYRDFELGTHGLYFSYPISRYGYMVGRFLGTLVILMLVFSSLGFGAWFASIMPFVKAEKFGAFQLSAYVMPYLTGVLPNQILMGSLFYTLALRFRKRLPIYVTAVGFFMGYLLAMNLVGDLDNKFIGAMLDPFGNIASMNLTRYWTAVEKNTLMVTFTGDLLLNRLVWLAVGLTVLWVGTRKFSLSYFAGKQKKGKGTATINGNDENGVHFGTLELPKVTRSFSFSSRLKLFVQLCKREFLSVVKNIYFSVILLFGVIFVMITGMQVLGNFMGTTTFPVTYQVLQITGGLFGIFVIIILTFYAGELVWRDRDKKFAQIMDATPVPVWSQFLSKLVGLMAVMVFLSMVVMVCGLLLQTFKGYFNYEIGLHVTEIFGVRLITYFLFAVLAMTVHVLVNHKYMGHFIMIVYYIVSDFLPQMGLEHKLFLFPETARYVYSDMNGYGHFMGPHFMFKFYWVGFAIMMAVAAHLFWVRGTDTALVTRLKKVRQRFTPLVQVTALAGFLLTASLGSVIYYNTNVLNDFKTNWEQQEEQVNYEKKYKQFEKLPQPRITDVKVNVDIFPYQRKARAKGSYVLKNKTQSVIDSIHVGVNSDLEIGKLEFLSAAKRIEADKEMGYYIYRLDHALAPGDTITLEFDLTYAPKGFRNSGLDTAVVYNGTFFNSGYLPHIGYNADGELTDDDDRAKHGLQPRPRMADVNDLEARRNTYISSDSDWVTYDAVVSTAKDQIAITPGYLEKEWVDGDRRYFHYTMDRKTLNFFSYISAKYEVRRDKWNDVAIEIYYHKGHPYNVEQMVESVKDSLEYFSKNFGPYQHKLVRILEFPRYASFAQSFPTTIPYSEAIGFIARVKEGDVDYPYEVTAHEVAHQWWAHQVIGGNVQGATLLSEVLSQYSTLMTVKKRFDDKVVRKSLKYNLDRYFRGRSGERKKEVPLMLIENQGYLHYNKGIVVMNALVDYIGEDALNAALARYVKDVAYCEPPYPNSVGFLEYLREATPEHLKYIITDLFETITLYENKTLSATYKKKDDGKYEVTVKVAAKKLRADEKGVEKEIAVNDYIDIGVLDKDENPLYLAKHKIESSEESFTVTVDKEPHSAGIDPFHKLLDRRSDDNTKTLKKD